MKEQKTSFTEQIADEGAYITQNAEVSDDERLYLTARAGTGRFRIHRRRGSGIH